MSRTRWTCARVLIAALAGVNFLAFGQQKETPAPSAALSKDAALWEHRITGKIVSIGMPAQMRRPARKAVGSFRG